ncbi:MAG: hypothetical protein HQL95_00530 [Magnetococcales bacterium]|nr:hypothetical protein [Magnetococcales bacterium]
MMVVKTELDELLADLRSAKVGNPELDLRIAKLTGVVPKDGWVFDEHRSGPKSKWILNPWCHDEAGGFYPRYTQSLDATENAFFDDSWWWESMKVLRIMNRRNVVQEYRFQWTAHGISESGDELAAMDSHPDNKIARAICVVLSHAQCTA